MFKLEFLIKEANLALYYVRTRKRIFYFSSRHFSTESKKGKCSIGGVDNYPAYLAPTLCNSILSINSRFYLNVGDTILLLLYFLLLSVICVSCKLAFCSNRKSFVLSIVEKPLPKEDFPLLAYNRRCCFTSVNFTTS